MTIKFAIIGTNKITHQFVQAAADVNDLEFYAVYSRKQKTADEFADQYGVSKTYILLEQMLHDSNLDAVYIASPNSFHAQQAIKLMDAGKHVLCEKPMAANQVEVEQMIAAAKRNQVCLMEGMFTSHLPNFKVIENNLHKLGDIHRYSAGFCQYSSRYDAYKTGQTPNTFNPDFANGALIDVGIYALYPAVKLFGFPDKIVSVCHQLETGVDGYGDVLMSYPNQDLIAHACQSKINHSAYHNEIQGELATMVIDHISLLRKIEIHYKDGRIEDVTQPQHDNGLFYEAEHFASLIKDKQFESPVVTWKNSLDVSKIIDHVRLQNGVAYPNDAH